MAIYFVASGGSNTAPYDTWAKAATSLQTALDAATADGDLVIIQHNGVPSVDAELSADTNYLVAGNVVVIAASNDGGSAYTPTAMGTSNWLGHSTLSRIVGLTGGFKAYFYGLTFRVSGSTSKTIYHAQLAGADFTYEDCTFWLGSGSGQLLTFGSATGASEYCTTHINSTFIYGNTAQHLLTGTGKHVFYGGGVSSSGSAPLALLGSVGSTGSGTVEFYGFDCSHAGSSLIENQTSGRKGVTFVNCKFPASVTVLDPQTTYNNRSQAEALVINCSSGDQHYHFGHYDPFGETVVSTTIYANDGAEYNTTGDKFSWKITTTANCTFYTPYVSPWLHKHNETLSAITPSLEILRDGSATAYQNDEVWAEFSYQGTSGSPLAVFVDDRKAMTGAAADQTTGALSASGWTGENATAWFGKLAPAASITPAEIGPLSARVCVGEPSITVYVDPQIRT